MYLPLPPHANVHFTFSTDHFHWISSLLLISVSIFLICNLVVFYFFCTGCYSECQLLACLSSFCIFAASILLPVQGGIYVRLSAIWTLFSSQVRTYIGAFILQWHSFTLQAKMLEKYKSWKCTGKEGADHSVMELLYKTNNLSWFVSL